MFQDICQRMEMPDVDLLTKFSYSMQRFVSMDLMAFTLDTQVIP